MSRLSRAGWCAAWILSEGLEMTSNAQADELLDVQVLRVGGCGGLMPAAASLHHSVVLDRVAEQWAHGLALSVAAQNGSYPAGVTAGMRVAGSDNDMIMMRCDRRIAALFRAMICGISASFSAGPDSWLVLGSAASYVAGSLPQARPRPQPRRWCAAERWS